MITLRKLALLCTPLLLLATAGCIRKDKPEISTSETEIDHLLLFEFFYNGNYKERKDGGSAHPMWDDTDPYIKIYNPTKEVKYLDGLALVRSAFEANKVYEFTNKKEDFRAEHMAVDWILHFPGTGKDHPIKPGEVVILTNIAIDHTKSNNEEVPSPNSYDLTNAKFEWWTKRDVEEDGNFSTDNEAVPNLEKTLYPYEASSFSLENHRCYALVDIKKEDYLNGAYKKHQKHYTITVNATGSYNTYDSERVSVTVPNDKVIDAVTISDKHFASCPVAESLDRGYKGSEQVYVRSKDAKKWKDGGGWGIRRKWDGKKYVDDNNSTSDFEVVKASNSTDATPKQEANSEKKESEANE